MKIRFIKEFNGISKGTVLEIADHYGKSLISKKIAVDFAKNKAEKTENDSETASKSDVND
ncbi:MAG: hypothetical protein IIZ94_05295 [Prevotella sp.]|nr:hypothetical protein [Prevotella sp.]